MRRFSPSSPPTCRVRRSCWHCWRLHPQQRAERECPHLPRTIELGRFLAGIPHGAYFAIAMRLAADLAEPHQQARAVSKVRPGLSVATVVGVPTITARGQALGWRSGFVVVAARATLTAIMLWRPALSPPGEPTARPASEVTALTNPQVLTTVAVGVIGFGGMFSVYSYFSSIFVSSGAGPEWMISPILMIYGVGLAIGSVISGRLADGSTLQVAAVFQAVIGAAADFYAFAVGNGVLMTMAMFGIGFGGGITVPLQTRLMDVAGNAQTLAAALKHVAFNLANALGPFSRGPRSTGGVSVALAAAGLVLLAITARLATRRTGRGQAKSPAPHGETAREASSEPARP